MNHPQEQHLAEAVAEHDGARPEELRLMRCLTG
jgi:hypothetical protein